MTWAVAPVPRPTFILCQALLRWHRILNVAQVPWEDLLRLDFIAVGRNIHSVLVLIIVWCHCSDCRIGRGNILWMGEGLPSHLFCTSGIGYFESRQLWRRLVVPTMRDSVALKLLRSLIFCSKVAPRTKCIGPVLCKRRQVLR